MSYATDDLNISYKYDTNGLRTEKTVNGVKHEYYYVDGQLRFEKNGDSYEIYYNYDAEGRPVRAYKKDLVTGTNYSYYLITNTRGDVIETRNGSGEVNAKFTYDAWGKIISVTDGSGNELSSDSFAYQISLKYRGYVYDSETGLYYLQSRYYDPETGRFLNTDSVDYIGYSGEQLSYNAFAYCENEPVNKIDSLGLWAYDVHAGFYTDATGGKKGKTRDKYKGYYLPFLDTNKNGSKEKSEVFYGTYWWALCAGFKKNKISMKYARIIAKACNDVDSIFDPVSTLVSNQSWHFNTNGKGKSDSRIEHAIEYIDKAEKCFKKAMKEYRNNKSYKKKVKEGCTYFGYALHAIQDTHAHSDDRCYYIMIAYSTGLTSRNYVAFWMHSPSDGTDNASKRKDALKKTKEITTHMLETLYKNYSEVLIRSR